MTVNGCLIRKLVSFMESQETHSEAGQTLIKLSINEFQAVTVFIGFLTECLQQTKTEKDTFTQEFLQLSKEMTLNDKLKNYSLSTQVIQLLKTLVQGSTTRDEAFLSSWNKVIEDSCNVLLFQAKTDFAGSDTNCSNGNSYKTIQNSWFSKTLIKHQNKSSLKTFLQFCKFLLVDGTEREDTPLRTRKVRLKLTSLQKKKLRVWSDHHRYTYNKATGIICDNSQGSYYKGVKPESSGTYYSKLELRNMIVPESACSRVPWLLETPKSIREHAVFEACSNVKTNMTNIKNGTIRYFSTPFRSRKKTGWSIGVSKDSVKCYGRSIGVYEMSSGMRFKTTEDIYSVDHDCKLHFDGLNYFILVQAPVELKTNTQYWFVALDPGVRKFQTVFSPDADEHLFVGNRDATRLYEKLLKLDKMISENARDTKILKARQKIQYLQTELHNKLALFLCSRYRNIYIPKLTKENDIISKHKRRIRTKAVRQMVVFAHCKFVERLKTKAEEFTNVKVHVITEEFTSQKCLMCKRLTKTSDEIYVCKHCGYSVDRDMLGSTNILLKHW